MYTSQNNSVIIKNKSRLLKICLLSLNKKLKNVIIIYMCSLINNLSDQL